jgi:hypothetical protein
LPPPFISRGRLLFLGIYLRERLEAIFSFLQRDSFSRKLFARLKQAKEITKGINAILPCFSCKGANKK